MEGPLEPGRTRRPGQIIIDGPVADKHGGYKKKLFTVAMSTLTPSGLTGHDAASGRDLHRMAQQYGKQSQSTRDLGLHHPMRLKKPRNLAQRFVYALTAISPVQAYWQTVNATQEDSNVFAPTRYQQPAAHNGSRFNHGDFPDRDVCEVKRVRRGALAQSSLTKPDWKYRLAAFMNLHAAFGLDLNAIDDEQLAKAILHNIEPQSKLLPDIARLTLFGSHRYGERRGEGISQEQQRVLIGQALCKLIFKEDSIALRAARIFARIRPCTLRKLTNAMRNWTFATEDVDAQRIWRRHYEAYEMPDLYLRSVHKLGLHLPANQTSEPAVNNTDNIWVGSPTWVLLHTGARAILSSGSDDLSRESELSLIQLGLGIINTFEPGFLSNAAEPSLYSGLLIYHLFIQPDSGLEDNVPDSNLTRTFDHLIGILSGRHHKAQQIYDSFTDYRQVYNTQTWRSRKLAARELLSQTCGNKSHRLVPIKEKSFMMALQDIYKKPVLQLMAYPADQRCLLTNNSIPNLDEYYRSAVEKIALNILRVDMALLAVAFTPSDFNDDNFQHSDRDFLDRARIQLVEPRLYRNRHPHEMFFSNVVVTYSSKVDTAFFLAIHHHQKRLYCLRTTENGYMLRQINIEDPELRDLRPYMRRWPTTKIKNRHTFSLLTLNKPPIEKTPEENLVQLYTRYADMHYQAYRVRLYEKGYEKVGTELPELIEDIKGLIIPLYDCINSLIDGKFNAAFLECSIDGMLVVLPLVFTGLKTSLSLYRQALIGAARTFERSTIIATRGQLFERIVPISTQIAGGVVETSEQLQTFLFSIGKQAMISFDPGIAAMRSLGKLGNSLHMAIMGHALLKILPQFIREGLRLSSETHKILTVRTSRLFEITYGYGENGQTPLTLTLNSVDYSILETQSPIIQAPMIVVENGELTSKGDPVFVQLDMQTQLGIDKKYICIDVGKQRCQLQNYHPQDATFTVNPQTAVNDDEIRQWLFIGTAPIYLVVIYPQHRVSFAGRQKLFFEINGQGWSFCPTLHELNPVGYLDDWQMKPRSWDDPLTTLDITGSETDLQLNLPQAQSSVTLSKILWKFRASRAFLSPYEIHHKDLSPETIGFYDHSSLMARIDDHWYWLVPESRKSTFLLTHPLRRRAASLRVTYDFASSSFLLATPSVQLNAHRLGEALAREMAGNVGGACINRLLPPLLNGAFRFGDAMFIKSGENCLSIEPYDDLYYIVLDDENQDNPSRWTLRYELFTESFALAAKTDPMFAPINHQRWSRPEELAMRTYNKTAFPTFNSLCQPNREEPALHSRLRQTALLIRLDPARRITLLHASSATVRAFKMDMSLTAAFRSAYPALALWTTFENVRQRLISCGTGQIPDWDQRQLAGIDKLPVQFPPPGLVTLGLKQQLFLLYDPNSRNSGATVENVELIIDTLGLSAIPLVQRDGLHLWLPDPLTTPQVIVSKSLLSIGRQITFWLDEANRLIGRQPEGADIRFGGHLNRTRVDKIIVSPDSEIVVLIYNVDISLRRAEFYRLPASQIDAPLRAIQPYKQKTITGKVESYSDYWVTNQGELFVPRDHGWAAHDNARDVWPVPAGFKPGFITTDQHYLGYVRGDANLHHVEVMLYDIINREHVSLYRSKPHIPGPFGASRVIALAFSALNTLVAVGYSDGYIEIYSIVGPSTPAIALPLGGTCLPLARYIIDGDSHPKAKQMAMMFNNAFDNLMVFHDTGDCDAALAGNFTFAVTRIFPGKCRSGA